MRIYSILPLVENYKQLWTTDPEHIIEARIKELTFKGDSKTTYWRPMTLRWSTGEGIDRPNEKKYDKETYDKDFKIPDIAYWQMGCLVLSPKATSIIRPVFHNEAEFLPVTVGREDWYVFNIINVQDAVKEIIEADLVTTWSDKIFFNKNGFTNAKLFRVDRQLRTFTSDVPGSFKEIVENNNLTGIEFNAIEE